MVGLPTDVDERRLLLGRYKLDVQLGMGGTSRIYRAIDESDGRPVAIKMLRVEHAQNPEVVGRFRREHPQVKVEAVVKTTAELIEQVDIDAADAEADAQ